MASKQAACPQRQQRHHKATTPHTTIAAPPYQTPTTPPRRFTQVILAQQCPQLCKRCPAIVQVQAFLLAMPFVPIDDPGISGIGSASAADSSPQAEEAQDTQNQRQKLGFTWLELYGLYRLAGHPEPIQYSRSEAVARPTLRQQLHAFRHTVRQLVLHTMPSEQQHLVKGTKQPHSKRLDSLGIATHLAILPWQPCLTAGMQERLAQEILRSQHRLSYAKARQAIAEHHHMAMRQVQLKGRAKWSGTIKPYKQPLYATHAQIPTDTTARASSTTPSDYHLLPHALGGGQGGGRAVGDTVTGSAAAAASAPSTAISSSSPMYPASQGQQSSGRSSMHIDQPHDPPPNVIYLRCPRCPHKLPGTKPVFHDHNLDQRVWCNSCRKSLFVRQWKCGCGLPRHVCPVHKDEPAR